MMPLSAHYETATFSVKWVNLTLSVQNVVRTLITVVGAVMSESAKVSPASRI